MNIIAITQARVGSTRLPSKVLRKIGDKTLLAMQVMRVLQSRLISKLIIATTSHPQDDAIDALAKQHHWNIFRGSEQNVLDRYYHCATNYQADYVVRLTADCPLMDAALIDQIVEYTLLNQHIDYCSNTLIEHYPNGVDIEVFKMSALQLAWQHAQKPSDLEHVTLYIRNNSSFMGGDMFHAENFACNKNYGHVRFTVDEEADFQVVEKLIQSKGLDATWLEYTEEYLNQPSIAALNKHLKRNSSLKKMLEEEEKLYAGK